MSDIGDLQTFVTNKQGELEAQRLKLSQDGYKTFSSAWSTPQAQILKSNLEDLILQLNNTLLRDLDIVHELLVMMNTD